MTGFRFTPEAATDLFEICSYIAADNQHAADRVETAIYEACSTLAQTPDGGQMRPEFTDRQFRFWTVRQFPNYLVVYRPDSRPIEILRVLHGMRSLKRILGSRGNQ
jgi:plasmid stabilization system protein ParE